MPCKCKEDYEKKIEQANGAWKSSYPKDDGAEIDGIPNLKTIVGDFNV